MPAPCARIYVAVYNVLSECPMMRIGGSPAPWRDRSEPWLESMVCARGVQRMSAVREVSRSRGSTSGLWAHLEGSTASIPGG